MTTRVRRLLFAASLLYFLGSTSVDHSSAYWLNGSAWPTGSIVMHLQLGEGVTGFLDGFTGSLNQIAEAALATWDNYIDRSQFTVVRNSSARIADGNLINNVFFSDNAFGEAFDADTLAITTTWTRGGTQRIESDVIFNAARRWNSYRGGLRSGTEDLRRVALHEFGHALGLGHPDQHGQLVFSIMNSRISSLDSLTGDDISGGQALYAVASASTVPFPPRNELFDFRSQLESKYRDQFRRPSQTTFVDIEGDVVWTSEYFRYRTGLCSHDSAVARVFSAIDNTGVFGLCGTTPAGSISFPPRDEALAFRTQLEAKYRDGLRRAPSSTTVDNEGDVVWVQEYLRYRVNGCGHADAVGRVFLQIDGRGIQPTCR